MSLSVLDFLTSDTAYAIVVFALPFIFGWIKKREWAKQYIGEVVVDSVEAGVREVYEYTYRKAKQVKQGEKLTPEEGRQLRLEAMERAKIIASERGVDIIKELGPRILETMVHRAAERSKTLGRMGKQLLEVELDSPGPISSDDFRARPSGTGEG